MILEVGAGGCIMVTPPAKGSALEKAMNSERIGGVTINSLQQDKIKGQVIDLGSGCSVFKSEASMTQKKDPITVAFESAETDPYVRHPRDVPMRDENGGIVVKGDAHSYSIVYLHRRGDIVLVEDGQPLLKNAEGYRRYSGDVYATDSVGNMITDVNGNKLVRSKAGDIQFNEDGKPLKDWKLTVPRTVFNGINDGQQYHPMDEYLARLQYWTDEEFDDLFDKVLVEKLRRGKANLTTVVRL